jgi:hypothetical protein
LLATAVGAAKRSRQRQARETRPRRAPDPDRQQAGSYNSKSQTRQRRAPHRARPDLKWIDRCHPWRNICASGEPGPAIPGRSLGGLRAMARKQATSPATTFRVTAELQSGTAATSCRVAACRQSGAVGKILLPFRRPRAQLRAGPRFLAGFRRRDGPCHCGGKPGNGGRRPVAGCRCPPSGTFARPRRRSVSSRRQSCGTG